ncbi:hypothetical protein ABLB69_19940 [Xenorhabdus khoisanae]|uniref:hypothetical protein n=1 Tax=Xenorhabdus khoisanae TaxID=880157 RepID=UPI0032B74548
MYKFEELAQYDSNGMNIDSIDKPSILAALASLVIAIKDYDPALSEKFFNQMDGLYQHNKSKGLPSADGIGRIALIIKNSLNTED